MRARVALTLFTAAAGQRGVLAMDDANSTDGVAGIVPRGYTEVCAIRGDLPDGAKQEGGNNPSPFVILTYGAREYTTPTQDATLAPVWQGSGCNTFPTVASADGTPIELRLELWDDRSRVYDPLSVRYKDALLASGATSAAETRSLWVTLREGAVSDARIFVAVTVSPPFDDGTIDNPPDRFKSLTSTPAFFVYVGAATFVIIVCVCCMWGKGTAPPPRPMPPDQMRKGAVPKSFSSDVYGTHPSTSAALLPAVRPELTIEVATPHAGREMEVTAVAEKPAVEPKKEEPAKPAPPPSRWPTIPNIFGGV